MFNLIDVIVIAVILISTFVGYKRGFVKTVLSFLSFFIAIGVSLAFYKPLAVILTEKTTIDEWVIEKIETVKEVSGDKAEEVALAKTENEQNNPMSVIEDLPSAVIEKLDVNSIKNNIRHEIALKVSELIMKLLSLIIIYLVVKVTLIVAGLLLGGLMKLPILKQLNEILGMSFGVALGFIEIYVVFAIFTFISSITDISFIIDAIKSSAFASMMFENNLIIRLLF